MLAIPYAPVGSPRRQADRRKDSPAINADEKQVRNQDDEFDLALQAAAREDLALTWLLLPASHGS